MFRLIKSTLAVALTVAGLLAFSSASLAEDAPDPGGCPGCIGTANPAILQFPSPPGLNGMAGARCDVRHNYTVRNGLCNLFETSDGTECRQAIGCDASFWIKCVGPDCVDANGNASTISGLFLQTPTGLVPIVTGGCGQTFPLGQLGCGSPSVTLCSVVAYPLTPGGPISALRCTLLSCTGCEM